MAKTPNYTAEQEAVMVEMYGAVIDKSDAERDAVVQELANMYGRKVRSVRAKLSNMKLYRAKTPVAKDGEPAVRKDVLANELVKVAGVPLTSAENLTKVDIKALIQVIKEARGESDESDES